MEQIKTWGTDRLPNLFLIVFSVITASHRQAGTNKQGSQRQGHFIETGRVGHGQEREQWGGRKTLDAIVLEIAMRGMERRVERF